MKNRKVVSIILAAAIAASLAACGSSSDSGNSAATADSSAAEDSSASSDSGSAEAGGITYDAIELGTTGTDITASISVLTQRTDMLQDDYNGTTYPQYIEEFNKMYPNITVDVQGITDYASEAILRLQGGDWGDIMMIPAIDKSEYSNYFTSFGSLDVLQDEIRFASNGAYDGQVYGVPSTGNAQGVLYNKKVFSDAGITELPKTPEDFIADLQLIRDNTDAIPLYTNYAAGWTMGAWDDYISGTATGDSAYMNQKLAHTEDPMSDPGDGTHAYNVYKILYDAVANGLTEDDFSTTDWEGSKGMLNRGEIGTMVLGSWAYSQMQAAGDNPDDIGYMSFPITVDDKQYATSGPDYMFCINNTVSEEEQEASMIFIKWMTEESGFSYNEGGIPIAMDDNNWPDVYSAFNDNDVTLIANDEAIAGEENLLSEMNAESELNFGNGGDLKVQEIIEHASNQDETFDEIMNEWNQKWSDAQEYLGVDVTY